MCDLSDYNDLVSIIVPVYNVENYLKKCINSLINQEYKNIEIILVDDGSKDNCPDLCDEYAKKDSRIKVLHKENGGLSDARNAGIKIAKGSFFYFVDSDDYISKNAISSLLMAIKKNNADLAIGSFEYVDESGKMISNFKKGSLENDVLNSFEALNSLYSQNQIYFIVAWNKLYKRELFDNICFPIKKIHEDEFVTHEILNKCKIICTVDMPLYFYVQREGSIMSNESIKSRIDGLDAYAVRCLFFYRLKMNNLLNKAFATYFYALFAAQNEVEKKDKKILKKSEIHFHKIYKEIKKSLNRKYKLYGKFPFLIFHLMKWKNRLKKFKRFIKKILFCFSKSILNLKFSKSKKIILLDTPLHGNLGDQAIALAERKYLKENFPNHSICEFDFFECSNYLKYIEKYIKKNDIIFIQGGGFVGSLWPNEQRMFINLLNTFKYNQIIVFPQTVYFYNKDQELLNEFIDTLNVCSNLLFLVREKKSYDFMKKIGVTCEIYLIPDIVFYLEYKSKKTKRNDKVLLCFRKDKEKTCNQEKIIEYLQSLKIEFDETDTVIDCEVKKKKSKKEVYKKILQFSKYSLIVCDRLHAMIFATLAHTPCITFDNVSHKVSGVYEWIKDLDFVRCISESELTEDLIIKMIKKQTNVFGRDDFIREYNRIKEWCDENEN